MDLTTLTLIKLAIICLGILTGLTRYNNLSDANKIFWVYLIVALSGEILEALLARYFGNNFPIYHVYRPLYYAILTIGMAWEMKRVRKLYLYSIPIVIMAACLNGFFLQPPDKALNTIIINLVSVLLIFQVLYYVAILFEEHSWEETIYHYSFWIAIGILIHSISSFLSLGIHNLLDAKGQATVVQVQVYSEFVFYGAFTLNFLLQKMRLMLKQVS